MPDSFILNNRQVHLSPKALLAELEVARSQNEKSCLEFILHWIQGDEEFEQFTSGSTGPPKLLKLSRKQLIASSLLTKDFFQLRESDTLFCCLGVQYIGGKMMLVRALVLDLPLVVKDPDSRPFLDNQYPIQFTSMVPLQMMATLTEGNENEIQQLQACKAILLGGASVSHTLMDMLQKLSVPVYQSFATSESASHIAMRKLNGKDADSYYTVLPGIQISTDSRGALVMKGAVTNDIAVVTSDMVELKNETQFRWLGRADFVVNSGGIKIYPEAVEAEMSLIMEKYGNPFYMVASLPDELLSERLVLCLEKLPVEESILFSELEQALPRYLVPKQIICIGKFPLLKSGKIARSEVQRIVKKNNEQAL